MTQTRTTHARLASLALLLVACAKPASVATTPADRSDDRPSFEIPLGHAAGQFHTLPVRVHDQETVAILDTGIGLAIISQDLCDRIGCTVDGEFTGQRMSGQSVTVPTTHLEELAIGSLVQSDVVAAVVDIEGFFPEPHIEAFVGLPFFREHPFTIDGPNRTLTLESEASLAERGRRAAEVPIRLASHGVALDSFVHMTLGEAEGEFLMDSGSKVVILHPRYAEPLSVDLDDEALTRREGTDETGNPYLRVYATIANPIAFRDAPTMSRTGADALFQEIIYDGLLGADFLSSFVLTWDLPNARMLIAN